MTRLVRVAVSPLAVGEIELGEAASRYLVRVHRLREGDRFMAFDPAVRLEAEGEILSSSPRAVRCRFASIRESSRISGLKVTLFQGLGKGDKPDRVIRDATQLGVARIALVESERSVPRLAGHGAERLERWTSIALDAARQSGRGDVPEIGGVMAFSELLARASQFRVRIVLEPTADRTLLDALGGYDRSHELALLIGPEGGFSAQEIDQLQRAGFARVRFGPFTLRTETAATAVLGALVALADLR